MRIVSLYLFIIFMFFGCTATQPVVYTQPIKIETKKVEPKKEIIVSELNTTVPYDNNTTIQNDIPKIESETIAIIFSSSKIGKYAIEATNTINTYLLYKNENFNVKVYDIVNGNKNNIDDIYSDIKSSNINKVIAMIPNDDLKILKNIENVEFYLPLINKNDIDLSKYNNSSKFIFGAISYHDQFNKLIEYSNSHLLELYDNTYIGSTLHNYLRKINKMYSKKIDDRNGYYKNFLENERFINSSIILNTPIVKSSILLSQINGLEVEVSQILSTQLNYTPLLLSLTQKADRKNIIIANSISQLPNDLLEYNNLMGINIEYSWVNYSIILGVEYLISNNLHLFDNVSIKDNQVIYPVELYKVTNSKFKKIDMEKMKMENILSEEVPAEKVSAENLDKI